MSAYEPEEVYGILTALSEAPLSVIKYKKFERLGVVMTEKDGPEKDNSNYPILHVCSVCRKVLPSSHLLDLHFAERHDSFFEVQKDKKPMYTCYLKGCQVMSSTTNERKDHCMTVHKFPSTFRFDNAYSTKPKPPPSVPEENGQENKGTADMDTSGPVKIKTKMVNGRQILQLETAPIKANLRFGWHTKKGFEPGGSKKKSPKKTANGHAATPMDTMNEDLKDALPDSEDVDLVPEMDASRPSWLDEKRCDIDEVD